MIKKGVAHRDICSSKKADMQIKVQRTVIICKYCGALHLLNVGRLYYYKYFAATQL